MMGKLTFDLRLPITDGLSGCHLTPMGEFNRGGLPVERSIIYFSLLMFARNNSQTISETSMRQDSETNIIVLNTALKYKIPREKKYITTQTHTKNSQCRSQRDLSHVENFLKAFTEEKLLMSHGKLFQTLITRSVGVLQRWTSWSIPTGTTMTLHTTISLHGWECERIWEYFVMTSSLHTL